MIEHILGLMLLLLEDGEAMAESLFAAIEIGVDHIGALGGVGAESIHLLLDKFQSS